ncbi:hypothetical protein H8958_022394 [Nasalis larvatus]
MFFVITSLCDTSSSSLPHSHKPAPRLVAVRPDPTLRGPLCECVPSPVSTVDSFKEVEDSLCVPQYNKYREERVILFLKMASGHAFQPDLVKRIHDTIHMGLSVRHVPSLILESKGIPCTLNGKKVEVAVKQIIAGKAVEQ